MKRSRTRKGRLVDSQRRLLDQQKQEKNMVTNKLSCGTSCTCARCQATAEFFGVTERRRENQSKVGREREREGEYDIGEGTRAPFPRSTGAFAYSSLLLLLLLLSPPSLFSSIFQWWKGRGFHVSGISGIGEALTRAEIKCDKPVFLKGIRLYDNKTRKERLLYLLPFFPGNVAVNAESQEGLVSLLSPLIGAGRSGTNLGRIEHRRAPGQCFTSWLDNHSTFWVYPFAHWDYLYIVAVQYLILQTVGKR